MLHAMYAAARREELLAEARQSRLVAQWRISGTGRQAERRQRKGAMPTLRMTWLTLPLAGAQGGNGGRQGI
jgi:hypothetical protein